MQKTSTAISMLSTEGILSKTKAITTGIVLASAIGGLTVMFLVTTIIYRCVFRKICFER